MFYRIRNHIFNLDEVVSIHIGNDGYIRVEMKDNSKYIINSEAVSVNALMDKIEKDLAVKE